jgi:hypothetical protein
VITLRAGSLYGLVAGHIATDGNEPAVGAPAVRGRRWHRPALRRR